MKKTRRERNLTKKKMGRGRMKREIKEKKKKGSNAHHRNFPQEGREKEGTVYDGSGA